MTTIVTVIIAICALLIVLGVLLSIYSCSSMAVGCAMQRSDEVSHWAIVSIISSLLAVLLILLVVLLLKQV